MHHEFSTLPEVRDASDNLPEHYQPHQYALEPYPNQSSWSTAPEYASSTAPIAGQSTHSGDAKSRAPDPSESKGGGGGGDNTVLQVKRSTFLRILAAAAAFVIFAIGIGVGVGVGVSSQNRATTQADAVAGGSASSTSSTDPTSTTTTAATTTSTTGALSPTSGTCPDAANMEYVSAATGKRFLLVCGIDYSGSGYAEDASSVSTSSLEACMDECANYAAGCTGAGWGYLPGDTGTDHLCYLKRGLNRSHVAVASWNFAILMGEGLPSSSTNSSSSI